MSRNDKKKQAEAFLRSNWCKIDDFHDWRTQTSWSCGACSKSRRVCTFSNATLTSCDNCPSAGCPARMEFRKVLFMQKFGIHEQAYEAWIREWRNEKNKKPTTATATEAKGKNAQSHNFKQPPTPIGVPQGGAGPSHHRSEGKAKKPQFIATNNTTQASTPTGWGSHTQPSTYNKHSRPLTLNELQGNFSSPARDAVAIPPSSDLNQQRRDGSNSSLDRLIDNQIKFFQSMREASDRHLKALADFQSERHHASNTEQELKEQVRSLEEQLRESQEGQEFLRSRLNTIVQDLQVEVQRDTGRPGKVQASHSRRKRAKEEDSGELAYPS